MRGSSHYGGFRLYLLANGPSTDVLLWDADVVELVVPEHDGERAKSTPAVSLDVPCDALALDGSVTRVEHDPAGEVIALSGVIPLLAAPGGKPIGKLDLAFGLNVRVLERRSGFARVTSAQAGISLERAGYDFDAWVAERFVQHAKPGVGLGSLKQAGAPPSHVSTAPLALRLDPDPGARVVATLVAGVPLLAATEHNGMRRIRVNGALGNNPGGDFWIPSSELKAHAKVWSSVQRP